MTLVRGLPDDALLRTTPEERQQAKWTVEMELLAQLIEETSIIATHNTGRKKPRQVPRPEHIRNQNNPRAQRPDGEPAQVVDMNAYRKAIGLLESTSRRVVNPDG